jgi:hypothetical protein
VQLGDDVGYSLADTRNLREPVFGDQHMKGDRNGRQAVCGPGIRFRPIDIIPAQGATLCVFT